jgi:hypothetical protein
MTLRQLTKVVVCSGLLFTAAFQAQSATKVVRAGQDATLLETKQKIDVKMNPKNGIARVDVVGTGADQIFRLTYRANYTSEKATDEIEYALDGVRQKASIEIEPKPLELSPKGYEEIFKAIFLLFMLALVLESALAVLFNWRPFVETLNARAVRPLVAFVFAYLFVQSFSLDLMTAIVNAATAGTYEQSVTGKVLTALVLAGGSAGVNNLLVSLGYRQKRTPETVAPKPPSDQAWIAVRMNRVLAVGPVEVFIGVRPAAGVPPPLVGVLRGTSKPGIRYFFSDPGRFPGYGGHQVPANAAISIELVGVGANSAVLRKSWGPFTVAGGAIIDLDFEV